MVYQINRRSLLAGSASLVGASMLPFGGAFAGKFPERPITVAMTAPAGGATDRGVRPLGKLLQKSLGAPSIALQNMSGAGGVQAVEYVMGQPADGYTWVGMNDTIESFALMGRYDYTWKDFDFWMSGGTACGIVVRTDSKIETFEQWMDWVSSKKGTLACSTTPSGSLWASLATYLKQKEGLDFRLAHYKGGGPSVRATLSGETNFGCMGVTPMVNFIRAGKLRCLAATVPNDWETAGTTIESMAKYFPDDQVMKDTFPWTNIHGIAVRKGVPEEILKQIDAAFAAAMADKSMEGVYNNNAFFPFRAGREAANELMRKRTEFQGYILEKVVGINKRSRDELGIAKIEG